MYKQIVLVMLKFEGIIREVFPRILLAKRALGNQRTVRSLDIVPLVFQWCDAHYDGHYLTRIGIMNSNFVFFPTSFLSRRSTSSNTWACRATPFSRASCPKRWTVWPARSKTWTAGQPWPRWDAKQRTRNWHSWSRTYVPGKWRTSASIDAPLCAILRICVR